MDISIRLLEAPDIPALYALFAEVGWARPAGFFERYLDEQKRKKRTVLVAFTGERLAGYVTINWWPEYQPFAEKEIPLLQDLAVLPPFRRRGVATALVDEAEKRIFERSPVAGIGVGLYADYGAAQRMYVLRGYVPDGLGLSYKDHQVKPGQEVRVDDDLCLYFIKVRESR